MVGFFEIKNFFLKIQPFENSFVYIYMVLNINKTLLKKEIWQKENHVKTAYADIKQRHLAKTKNCSWIHLFAI